MSVPTVPAGWPPVPGLEKEEPRLWLEEDIPQDDTGAERQERAPNAAASQRGGTGTQGEPSRERAGEQPPGEADAQRTA